MSELALLEMKKCFGPFRYLLCPRRVKYVQLADRTLSSSFLVWRKSPENYWNFVSTPVELYDFMRESVLGTSEILGLYFAAMQLSVLTKRLPYLNSSVSIGSRARCGWVVEKETLGEAVQNP